jgi:calcium-dependent protein kinase
MDLKFARENFVGETKGKLLDSYEVLSQLGKGGYGKVYKVKNIKTGEIRACKHLSKQNVKNLEKFRREIEILKKMDHPNIIKLYEVYESERSLYLVMELCNGGEIFDRIIEHIQNKKMYSEKDAAKIFEQVMSCIQYCHNKNICHRDLKPENLLYLNAGSEENNRIKVIDFGLSQACDRLKTKVGTAYYVSPEILSGNYTQLCDIWSAGVILYILLSGEIPFNGDNDREIYDAISNYKYNFNSNQWKQISPSAIDLIKKCLVPENIRLSAKEVLEHPWFKNVENLNRNFEINVKVFMNYINSVKLKQMIFTYIATRLTPEEEVKLKNIFISYDKDKDGNISLNELKLGLKQLHSNDLVEKDIENIYDSLDTDKDGKILYTEFLAALVGEREILTEEKLYRAFLFLDKDGSGKIDKAAIKNVILHNKYIDAEIDNIIEDADKNKDGVIDYNEFLDMMGFGCDDE